VPQKRHRHTHAGRVYDPCTDLKREFLRKSLQVCPVRQPLTGPLRMEVHFYFMRPKSHTTKKGKLRKGAPLRHVQTPDVDNLVKYVMDACNGRYYADDKQFIQLSAEKHWVHSCPRTCVEISCAETPREESGGGSLADSLGDTTSAVQSQ